MKKIYLFLLLSFSITTYSLDKSTVIQSVDIRLNNIKYKSKSILTFRKFYSTYENENHDLGAFQIVHIIYDPNKNSFFYKPLSKNFAVDNRAKIITDFLNEQVAGKVKLNHNFSIFVSLADTDMLPEKFTKNFNISSVPFIVFDLNQKNYETDKSKVLLMPDLYLIGENYESKRKKIIKKSKRKNYFVRQDKAMWRGSQSGGIYNFETKTLHPRGKLVWFSHENPYYVDAKFISYKVQTEDSQSGKKYINLMENTFGKKPEKYFVKFDKMTNYKYSVSLDGNVSAWQRVPWILASGSVLLYHTDFVQFFTPYLVENEHYIAIKPDMSDLKEKIDHLRANRFQAYKITKNAEKLQNEILNRDFIIEYYARAIQGIHDNFQS